MGSNPDHPPLIVIAGPTASGKTSLAIELASKYEGEIICADSRTVYKGMDIGTAKSTTAERRAVPHHLLDVATPDRPITVVDFKALAEAAIIDITSRGKVPFLVGGTGLYIDAIIYDFSFRGAPRLELRARLDALSVRELQEHLLQQGIDFPTNQKNKRHLIRQIESGGNQSRDRALRQNTLVLGVEVENDQLKNRLAMRLADMFARGLEHEAKQLFATYGRDCKPLATIGYQEFLPYFDGQIGLTDVTALILQHSIQYTKRQRTWFRRNKRMHYIRKIDEAVDLITTYLNKKAAQ